MKGYPARFHSIDRTVGRGLFVVFVCNGPTHPGFILVQLVRGYLLPRVALTY